MSITPNGLPVIAPRLEFGDDPDDPNLVRHDAALGLLNEVLDEIGLTVWIAIDRLDEAFQGFPAAEIPALRALFRTYLDLNEFPRLRLKLFVRKDLFRRIIGDGFVNLTHINARKIEIFWEEEDLRDLLAKRVRENPEFLHSAQIEELPSAEIFDAVFPAQVDAGTNRPTTWAWIMSRIRDGNGVRPPRNLIDLVKKAQQDQMRREEREQSEYEIGTPIIGSEALKKGLARLSDERVQDTLLAEAGVEYSALIEKFRDGKAEQNDESLQQVLGISGEEVAGATRALKELGFLEPIGATFKVPMLYRSGLNITQGKAFAVDTAEENDDEEEG
jgi:hypothetical protein